MWALLSSLLAPPRPRAEHGLACHRRSRPLLKFHEPLLPPRVLHGSLPVRIPASCSWLLHDLRGARMPKQVEDNRRLSSPPYSRAPRTHNNTSEGKNMTHITCGNHDEIGACGDGATAVLTVLDSHALVRDQSAAPVLHGHTDSCQHV